MEPLGLYQIKLPIRKRHDEAGYGDHRLRTQFWLPLEQHYGKRVARLQVVLPNEIG